MPPVSIPLPPRFRSRSRGSRVQSRSSSVDSLGSVDAPPVRHMQRWNGVTREATDWNSLRRDPELYFPRGNCLIYLFTQGASRRGPSFRIPYDFLLYSACRPLIEQALMTSMQSPVYHPGSTTPPSYENIHDQSATDHTFLSLYLDAPSHLDRQETFTYHVTTRNFVAWLVGVPLVGTDPVSALIDLKARMDIWRDVGADNFAALEQYVQEQSYGDFEEMESEMERRLNDPNAQTPAQPYRSLGDVEVQPVPSLEMDEKDMKRGRRNSISSSIRSTSSRIRRKFSRTRRGEDDDDNAINGVPPVPPTPTDPTGPRFSGPRSTATGSPAATGPRSGATAVSEIAAAKPTTEPQLSSTAGTRKGAKATADSQTGRKVTKRSSFKEKIKSHMSWLAGPLKPSDDAEPMPGPPGKGPPGAPGKGPGGPPGGGPPGFAPPPPPNPLPYRMSLGTKTFATESNLSMHSTSSQTHLPQSAGPLTAPPLGTFKNYSRPDLGQSVHGSAAGSRTSLHGTYVDGQGIVRCECCGKLAKKPSVQNMTSAPGSSAGPSYSAGAGPSNTHSRRGSMQGSVHGSGASFISAATHAHAHARDTSLPRSPVSAHMSAPGAPLTTVRHISSAAHAPRIEPVPKPTTQTQSQVPPSPQRQEQKRNFSREIFVPNYGNGLGMENSQQSSHGKGKERATQDTAFYPIQTQNFGYAGGPRGQENRNSFSSSNFTGLPELDFAGTSPPSVRSPASIRSPETSSFRSAQQVPSRPHSRGPSISSTDVGRAYHPDVPSQQQQHQRPGSAAGSLHGSGAGKQSSWHELVTRPSPYSGSIQRDSQERDFRSESVENLMHELEMAGISGPGEKTYGGGAEFDQGRETTRSRGRDGRDDDEMVGVGAMRTLGLRA